MPLELGDSQTFYCSSQSLLKLAEVFYEAGFPPGAVNFISGPGSEVGNELVLNTDVDMVSMTGGVETGKRLLKNSAEVMKDTALELGRQEVRT